MKKAIFLFSILFCFCFLGTAIAQDETVNTAIVLDGEMEDWENVPLLLQRDFAVYPDLQGTTVHWDVDTKTWVDGIDQSACMYNDGQGLDVGELKFANDADNLYFYWTRANDYMEYIWWEEEVGGDNINMEDFGFTPPDTAPCAADAVQDYFNFPFDYDHDMVFSFDKDLDGNFDFYLVMNIVIPEGTHAYRMEPDAAPFFNNYIYQDDGNGLYDGRDTETLIADLGTEYQQFPDDDGSSCNTMGVCQEATIGINTFFTDLGLEWGDAVWVRYEVHSADAIFTSPRSIYSFNKSNSLNLQINKPVNNKLSTKKHITIRGTVKKHSVVRIFVNGERQRKFVCHSGDFFKEVSLKMGANAVVVKAKKDSKTVTKAIKIRRK